MLKLNDFFYKYNYIFFIIYSKKIIGMKMRYLRVYIMENLIFFIYFEILRIF